MALEFLTGFEGYTTSLLTSGIWTGTSGATVQSSVVLTGSQSCRLDASTSYVYKSGLSNAVTRVVGFRYRLSSSPSENRSICTISDGVPTTAGNCQVSLGVQTDLTLAVYRNRALGSTGGTQLGSNSSNSLSASTNYYIELVVTVDNSAGTVEVYVNGSKTGWIDLTGQDTQQTANAYSNAFGLACSANGNNQYVDDVYTLTGSGSAPTTRLGDSKVLASLPAIGNGSQTAWTPSTGSDHGAMVDDTTPDSDTTYNEGAAASDVDTYVGTALGGSGTVHGLVLRNFLKKTDAGTCDTRNVVRIGSTNYYGSVENLSTSYLYYNTLYTTSPATSAAWSVSEIDAMQRGVERNA